MIGMQSEYLTKGMEIETGVEVTLNAPEWHISLFGEKQRSKLTETHPATEEDVYFLLTVCRCSTIMTISLQKITVNVSHVTAADRGFALSGWIILLENGDTKTLPEPDIYVMK